MTRGPFALYGPKKLPVIGMNGPGEIGSEESFFGVWSYSEFGDHPPLWKFAGPHGIAWQPRGVTLAPAHKEVDRHR